MIDWAQITNYLTHHRIRRRGRIKRETGALSQGKLMRSAWNNYDAGSVTMTSIVRASTASPLRRAIAADAKLGASTTEHPKTPKVLSMKSEDVRTVTFVFFECCVGILPFRVIQPHLLRFLFKAACLNSEPDVALSLWCHFAVTSPVEYCGRRN